MEKRPKIRFVDSYEDAPDNARYILRYQIDGSWLLQEYQDEVQSDLGEFRDVVHEKFHTILEECLKLMDTNFTLWVEKPAWMYANAEFDNMMNDLAASINEIYE